MQATLIRVSGSYMEEDPEVGEALVEKRKDFSGKMLR